MSKKPKAKKSTSITMDEWLGVMEKLNALEATEDYGEWKTFDEIKEHINVGHHRLRRWLHQGKEKGVVEVTHQHRPRIDGILYPIVVYRINRENLEKLNREVGGGKAS